VLSTEIPQCNLRLTFAKPKFEIGISRPQEYPVRDMVTRWHGGACTMRIVMHVGRWGSLCCARKDETRAFDMGLQSSCHVIWEMRKIGSKHWQSGAFTPIWNNPTTDGFAVSIRLNSATDTAYLKCDFASWGIN